ncbi:unnamed protein product, partial [Rotaria sp. Silwood2]
MSESTTTTTTTTASVTPPIRFVVGEASSLTSSNQSDTINFNQSVFIDRYLRK